MAFPKAIDKNKENSSRRVIRQGLFHICGMCGSRYGKEAQAEACLKNCISKYMAQQAVVDKPEKAGTVYRCAYCKRVYDKLILAKECAKVCKNDIQKKIEAETRMKKPQTREEKLKNLAAFAGGEQNLPAPKAPAPRPAPPPAEAKAPARKPAAPSAPAPSPAAARPASTRELPDMEAPKPAAEKPVHPAEGTKFDREGHSYKCHNCHQKYKKYQEAIACFDRHREQEKAGVTMKKEGDEKFYRDGAKYVCKKCNSKWFSRNEVISCFDGHKEEDEVWVTGGPKGKAKAEGAPDPQQQKSNLETLRKKRDDVKSEGEKFFRDGAKYVCRSCNAKYFTKSDVIQCFDNHSGSSAEAEPAATKDSGPILSSQDLDAATLEKALETVKPMRNRDGEDKFYRDGAKYVCKKCNTRYFTRNEVIQCFDKH